MTHDMTHYVGDGCDPSHADEDQFVAPPTDDDRDRGLYGKYHVVRIGGTPAKHDHCVFFVLDVDHDPHAIPALSAYEAFAAREYPQLSADIRQLIDSTHLRDHAEHDHETAHGERHYREHGYGGQIPPTAHDHEGTHSPAAGADGREDHSS